MAFVTMNIYKGQRMDVTAQMKDTDRVMDIFRTLGIRFDRKYTTITNDDTPSTITFKGLHAEKKHTDLTEMIVMLRDMAASDDIGDVCVKFTSFTNMRRKDGFKDRTVSVNPNSNEIRPASSEDPVADDTL